MVRTENEKISRMLFKQINDTKDQWKRKCGKILVQKKGSGQSNLVTHIKVQHPECYESPINQNLLKFEFSCNSSVNIPLSRSVLNIFGQIEWIYMGLKSFSFVNDSISRKYTNLEPITDSTHK